jgi:N-acetylglucosaminyldiphosphoundecaprenol N-acetyl-beta-D-mannosaminyltransferase
MTERIELFGIQMDNLTMSETLDRIDQLIRSGHSHQHVVVNVDKIVKSSKDKTIKAIISQCDLVSVDGMPIVWASRLLGKPIKERVAGIDLFCALVERAAAQSWPIYFLGAEQTVLEKVIARFKSDFPNLNVAGARNGYWSATEEANVIDQVCASGAKLLFVAISSPKKELLLKAIQDRQTIGFSMGVGGSFDVISGKVARAPVWMQKSGLEWFYRFLQEPNRLFKRYFIDAFHFSTILFRELANHRKR